MMRICLVRYTKTLIWMLYESEMSNFLILAFLVDVSCVF